MSPFSRSDAGTPARPKFDLGQVVITANANAKLASADVVPALARHTRGDWGDLCEEDRVSNERAIRDGGRLLSSYRSEAGQKFWIITEADRSVTTILMPQDY